MEWSCRAMKSERYWMHALRSRDKRDESDQRRSKTEASATLFQEWMMTHDQHFNNPSNFREVADMLDMKNKNFQDFSK